MGRLDGSRFLCLRKTAGRFIPLLMRQFSLKRLQRTRLTVAGWILILISLGIGAAAYNTASNILFMTLSLLLSSFVLSGILSVMNCRRLEWSLRAPAHLRCGESGRSIVNVRNRKSLLPAMCLCFRMGSSAAGKSERLHLHHALRAGDSSDMEWTFTPKNRGRFQLCLSGVESQFPFGFLSRSMGAEQIKEAIVWPERVAYRFKPDIGGQRFTSLAARRRAGPGTDLLNLRPYESGDPLRLIHWKATARLGKMVVRQLAMEGESGYRLYVNPDFGVWSERQFEQMCSLASSLAEDLYHSGRLEMFCFAGGEVSFIRSIRDLYDMLNHLALLERKKVLLDGFAMTGCRWIHLRPKGEGTITIYIDEKEAGQFNS